MSEILDMGSSTLLPVAVIVLSLCIGVRPGRAIRSGLLIGAGFVGIGLIVEMMNTQLGTAAEAMSERFGLKLSVVDIGWQGASPMAWASGLSAMAIVVAVLVNIVMLLCKLTRTVNLDLWNIWHMTFTGAVAYAVTGNLAAGLAGVALHAVISYKLGDLWAPFIEGYFELEGITVPHGTSAYMAPLACLVDLVIEHIPGLRRIHFSIDRLQERAGVLAEPVVIGGAMGSVIGFLAGDGLRQALLLGIEMAAVMVLMPQIVKCIMEGLLPLAERAKELLGKYFGGETFYIGLDPSILLGDTQVVTAGLLFIPLTLLLAMLVPGNRVLPFGDLATISFFIAISVAVHGGNLFRTLISGSLIMYLTIWITNETIPWVTQLGRLSGTIGEGTTVAAMDQGGSPITYLYVQLLIQENPGGFLLVGMISLACIAAAIYRSRQERGKQLE